MGFWMFGDNLLIMDRATVKVVPAFRDYLKHIVTDPTFPIKSVHQLVTLTSIKWLKNYEKATLDDKDRMVNEMIRIQRQAEDDGFLHNSMEMRGNE